MLIKITDCFDIWKSGDHIIDFKQGPNILVGPNGSGKSTTIIEAREYCRENKYHYLMFDNLTDGGVNHGDKLLLMERDISKSAMYITSSEGQRIIQAFGDFVGKIRQGVRKACSDSECNILFIFLDAVDSGLSINNIRDVKNLFNFIKEDCNRSGVELYIVVAANSYEFAKDLHCIDVKTGKPISFTSYEEYSDFICKEE